MRCSRKKKYLLSLVGPDGKIFGSNDMTNSQNIFWFGRTEEVATIIYHSRPFIFYAIDYFHGSQSTNLNVKLTVIKLEFNKMNVTLRMHLTIPPNQCLLAQTYCNSDGTQSKYFSLSSPLAQQQLLVHGSSLQTC